MTTIPSWATREAEARHYVAARLNRALARRIGAPAGTQFGWELMPQSSWQDIMYCRNAAHAACSFVYKGWSGKAWGYIWRDPILSFWSRTVLKVERREPSPEDTKFHRLVRHFWSTS